MKVGDIVILHPKYVQCPHPHEGKMAKVEEISKFLVRVSLLEFPKCNHREYHNRFWYLPEELESLESEVDNQ